ncbi:UNVERIFIED_CONTAM: hypothetical protein FKN15_008457 [Acipenser sinensis]
MLCFNINNIRTFNRGINPLWMLAITADGCTGMAPIAEGPQPLQGLGHPEVPNGWRPMHGLQHPLPQDDRNHHLPVGHH